MEKLHPKSVWLFFVRFIFAGIVLLFVVGGFAGQAILATAFLTEMAETSSLWAWIGIGILLLIIIYLVCCYLLARLAYRFWGYELTDNALRVEKGIIWKKYISIPYDRIQNVDIYRGLLVRILGLSDLHVQTAGYSGYGGRHGMRTEGRLPGLAPDVAEQLRERLVQEIRGAKQGL